MSNDDSKNRPLGIIEILNAFGSLATLGTTAYGAIQSLKGDTGITTVKILGFIFWAILIYIYIRKKLVTGKILVGNEPYKFKQAAYPGWARYPALVGMIAGAVLNVYILSLWIYPQIFPSNKIIVLVADFYGPDPQKYRVTGNIVEQVREATKEYDVQVNVLGESISYQNDSDYARTVGKEHNASIVLWGEYAPNEEKVQIMAYFVVIKGPMDLQLRSERILDVSELESFKIQIQLSHEISHLTSLVLGLTLYERSDYNRAIKVFTNLLTHPSIPSQMTNLIPIYYRGTAYILKRKYNQAIADFNQAIKLKPDFAEAYNNRGYTYYLKGNKDSFKLAINDFDRAIELDPDSAKAYHNRGRVYFRKDDYEKAISDFNQSIKLEPDFADAYYGRGNAYKKIDNIKQAIADYNQAIEFKPKYAEAYCNRGLVYQEKGEYDRAISDYIQAIKLKSDYALAFFNRGIAYSYKGEYDRAILDYNQAIKLQPGYVEAYINRGTAYHDKGEYDQAISDFNQAIKLNPNLAVIYLAVIYNNLGLAYQTKSEYNNAIDNYDEAIKLKPNFPTAYYNRGLSYSYKRTFDRAILDFSQAINLQPNYVKAYYERGLAYKIKGDKAKADFKRVLGLTNDPNIRQDARQQLQELGVE